MNIPALQRARAMCLEKAEEGAHLDTTRWGDNNIACGTVGCIGGWMTLDPELRRMGLRNARDARIPYDFGPPLRPSYGSSKGDLALMDFLELDDVPTRHLFGDHNPSDWTAAARRFDDVLEQKVS